MTARAVMTAAVITLVFGGIVLIFWLDVHRAMADGQWGELFQFAILSVMAASSDCASCLETFEAKRTTTPVSGSRTGLRTAGGATDQTAIARDKNQKRFSSTPITR